MSGIFQKSRNKTHTLRQITPKNGAAENFVKTFKRKLKAVVQSESVSVANAIQKFLFAYRSSKHVTTNEFPSKLLFGRELRTPLQLLRPDSKQIVQLKQEDQVRYFKGKRNETFEKGDIVMAKDYRKNYSNMSKAQIISDVSPRNCEIVFEDGGSHKRHYD